MNPLLLPTMALAVAALASVRAIEVQPTFYNMFNGNSGSYNYWDESYSGTGNKAQDGASLRNGLGDLTDGVIATENWFVVEAPVGPGPYVGWYQRTPSINFGFAGPQHFDSVTLYFDDSDGNGGVSAPSHIEINLDGGNFWTTFVPEPIGTAPSSFTIPIRTASTVAIRVVPKNSWVFLSEVDFHVRVPDAATTLGLLSVAFAGLAALRRRG